MNSLHPTWLSSLSANYNFQGIVVAYQIVYYWSCCIAQSTSTCFLIFPDYRFSATPQHPSVMHQFVSNTLLPSSLKSTILEFTQPWLWHNNFAVYTAFLWQFTSAMTSSTWGLLCCVHFAISIHWWSQMQVAKPAFSQTSCCFLFKCSSMYTFKF